MKNKRDWPQNTALFLSCLIAFGYGIKALVESEYLKGVLAIAFGVFLICSFFFKGALKFSPKPKKTVPPSKKPFDKDAFFQDAFSSLEEIEKKYTATPEELAKMPKKPLVDWDNGECPYPRDRSKPLGSRENPVVVGEPKSSTRLVYDKSREIWLLTDGLGNGWLR